MQAIKYIKLIPYLNFDLWDTKRYTTKQISSAFNIVDLGTCIKEENAKYKLYEDVETHFGILGVNNKDGIFDAYTQQGKDINQAYKKMKTGWLAYNPYRINVGSIGVKLPHHKNQYISPAYVVFSCLPNILPQYLFLIFKTQTFNKVINESTTGSVRQNLTIDVLKKLKIPLPSIEMQQKLISDYYFKIAEANELTTQADNLEKEIQDFISKILGIQYKENLLTKGLYFIEFNNIDRWDVWNKHIHFNKSDFPVKEIGSLLSLKSGNFLPQLKMVGSNYNVYGGNGKSGTHNEYFLNGKRIIIGRVGEYCGNVHLVDGNYWVTDNAFVVDKISDEVTYEFLEIALRALNLNKYRVVSAQPSISQSTILSLKIPVPALNTQNEICNKVAEYKKLRENLLLQVGKLKQLAEQEFEQAIFN